MEMDNLLRVSELRQAEIEKLQQSNRSYQIYLAYTLGMLKAAGVTYPSWLDEAVFDVEY